MTAWDDCPYMDSSSFANNPFFGCLFRLTLLSNEGINGSLNQPGPVFEVLSGPLLADPLLR